MYRVNDFGSCRERRGGCEEKDFLQVVPTAPACAESRAWIVGDVAAALWKDLEQSERTVSEDLLLMINAR